MGKVTMVFQELLLREELLAWPQLGKRKRYIEYKVPFMAVSFLKMVLHRKVKEEILYF